MWSLMPSKAGGVGPRPVARSTRESAFPSPSTSRNADKNGACTTTSAPPTHSRPRTLQSPSAKTVVLPFLNATTRSIGSVGRPVMSIRSHPRYTEPSGAATTAVGYRIVGASAASSIDQPSAATGKPLRGESPARAAENGYESHTVMARAGPRRARMADSFRH